MQRDRAYRRFQDRAAKRKTERLYLIWRCDERPHGPSEAAYRKKWVGQMANCHRAPCSCHMCGNVRRIWGLPTLAEQRSARRMRDILAEERDSAA